MKTVCPNCHQEYEVSEDYIQKEISCENCSHDFFVNKAKFCSDCGVANPAQCFECYSCHHPFQLLSANNSQNWATRDKKTNDRSKAELSILMRVIASIFRLGCMLAVIKGGAGVFFNIFSMDVSFGTRLGHIIVNVCLVVVYGRLEQILFILTHPDKKAIQTLYAQLALIGSLILSIIGLVYSSIARTGAERFIHLLASFFALFVTYKIFQLWNERCIMDENFTEDDITKKR